MSDAIEMSVCKKCNGQFAAGSAFCPYCGTKQNKGGNNVVFWIIVLIIGFAAFGNLRRSDSEGERVAASASSAQRTTRTPASTSIPPTPFPTRPPEWMALPYTEMCDNNATLTDVQQEDLAASMAGKKIVGWVGKVYDVERSGEAYKVQVDMRDGLFKSRQVELLGLTREVAAPLKVDQEIKFDGIIESVEMFAGDICNPINVVDVVLYVRSTDALSPSIASNT